MMVQTEIGLLPEDWEVETLENIGSFTKGSGISRSDSLSGRIPAVRYGELYTDHDNYIKTFHSFISPEVAKTSRKMKQGCILFTASGETKEDIGKAVAFLDDFEAYAGGDLIILNPKGDYSSQYLGYTLNSPSSVRQKAMMAQGDSVVHITTGSVQKVTVPIPSSTEQQNIASALSSIDKLIDDLGRTIQKKQRIREGAMEELLSGKKRLPGFTEEWVEDKLGRLCSSITTGKLDANAMNPHGKYRFYTCAKEYFMIDYYAFDDEALLISGNGENVGYVHYYMGKFNAYQRTYVLTGFKIYIRFAEFYLKQYLPMRIDNEKSDSNTPYIVRDTISEMIIRYPFNEKEAFAIADILTSMDDEISLLESERAKYEQIRSGMMEELLTGKKRLK